MSKMGISTLQSYKGAQVFEAVGLADEIVDRCFTGTTSRIQGADFTAIYTDIARFHENAYPFHTAATPLLQNTGQFHYRDGAEQHLNSPFSMVALQQAARTNSREAYKMYTKMVDETNMKCNLRGLLKLKLDDVTPVPLDEVEPATEILKRFATGAMSLGSISRETHETLAVAMNTLGGRSNTGEGGEDPVRFGDKRRSAIKQVSQQAHPHLDDATG
jgi:glutamate synthase (NADH)